MKLRIWSDIHNEFGVLKVTKTDDDANTVLIIAGDFFVWASPECEEMLQMLRDLAGQFKAVVYCAGNHEFYGGVYEEVIRELTAFAAGIDNFHFLDGDQVIIDDVRFVGGTLWTDLDDAEPTMMASVRYMLNDYRSIRRETYPGASPQMIDSDFIVGLNAEYRRQFIHHLSKPFDGKTVVMSHHLPDLVQALDYVGEDLAPAYGNTRMDDILTLPIDLWVHGHAHLRQEYKLGDIQVVANPRGYHGHQSMAYTFDDAKLWEI
jgi:predicted phosphodiesterase